ncbi:DUF2716 domain-containing protein [Micromonospora sonneratiae]|uniref:DUF2716 domain-containing protein n=1 Tax=Micromonospora sonneratiae TaxID=1184706 RepID=A0ABW3YJN7_9ACTN
MADGLLVAYETQLRARTPPAPGPLGAVFEQDGPIVQAHFGTHGTVDHRDLPGSELGTLVRRQQETFADRGEPVEWKVHASDPPDLAQHLVAAGFTPGWERHVLVAPIDSLSSAPLTLPVGQRIREVQFREHALLARIQAMAVASGPHRTSLAESDADGDAIGWGRSLAVLELDGRARAAGWAVLVDGTEFVSIGGMTAPEPAFLTGWLAWIGLRSRHPGSSRPLGGHRWRYLVAEATGELRAMFLAAGFQDVTTVRSYHWSPPNPPARERPVVLVFDDPEGEKVWERFASQWDFSTETQVHQELVEPPKSVTWHLAAIEEDDAAIAELESIVQRGLRVAVRPGERVYALHPNTQGYHFDPRRTGGPGQPRTPRCAYPDGGDHRLYTTADLRLGTFGDPWGQTLCVFGSDLLAEVEDDLTTLLGIVLRRGGHPVGNVWSFGPDGHNVTGP